MLSERTQSEYGHTFKMYSHEFAQNKIVQQITHKAEKNSGGSDARLLASLAIRAVEHMNSVVFGEQALVFSEAMQLATYWSQPKNCSEKEKATDFGELDKWYRKITSEAYVPSSPIGKEEIELFALHNNKSRRPSSQEPRIQARYITGSLLLYIMYLEPDFRDIHPTKPSCHARVGANSLASIITSDAANIMSRVDNTRDHQQDIDTIVEKGLINR